MVIFLAGVFLLGLLFGVLIICLLTFAKESREARIAAGSDPEMTLGPPELAPAAHGGDNLIILPRVSDP